MASTTYDAMEKRVAPQLPIYVNEVRYEFLRLLRARTFSLATIGFPVMFYLLFGVLMNHSEGEALPYSRYLLATYSVFGLVGASLFGISVTLANERALGWLELKLVSPMPAAAYLLAKVLSAMVFGVAICCILLVLGVTLTHARVMPGEVARLLLTVVAGVIPFASLGLMLAMVVPPNAAPGVINLIYLPMSFCSGLWIPLSALPSWLGKIAPIWPTYHVAQMALGAIGFPMQGSVMGHVLWLAAFSGGMMVIATVLFRRNASHG